MDDSHKIRLIGNNLPRAARPTKKEVENAQRDADALLKDSAIISRFADILVIAGSLGWAACAAIKNEMKVNWEVHDPDLVLSVLSDACRSKAMKMMPPEELLRHVRETVIPILEIIVESGQARAAEARDQ